MKKRMLIIIIILISCESNRIKADLIGMWLIQDFQYKDAKPKNERHISNVLIIKADGKIVLPVYLREPYDHNQGNWTLVKKGDRNEMLIVSENEEFHGNLIIQYLGVKNAEGYNIKELILESHDFILSAHKHPSY